MPSLNFENDPQNGKPYLAYDIDAFFARLRQNLGVRDIGENEHLNALLAGVDVFTNYIEGRPRRLDASILKVAMLLQDAYERGYSDRVSEDVRSAMDENAKRAKKQKHVYFIRSEPGEIKIGLAIDVQKRLRGLQTSHPYALTLLTAVKGSKEVECAYHKQFAEHRLHGEWFEPHPDILAEIERLNAHPTHQEPEQ